MKTSYSLFPFLLVATSCLIGCDASVEQFPPNRVHALVVATSREVPMETAAEDVTDLVDRWFGTPDQPRWPVEWLDAEAARSLVDPENLSRAAGPVFSDKEDRHFGLYTEHCVTCHGISGGGDGPAALWQNPYPRDFRAGVFKWKSTQRGAKPTRGDLMAVLDGGVPGTGMPTFRAVDEVDLEALVDYVIYLSVRGEFERRLLGDAVDELGYEGERPEAELSFRSVLDAEEDASVAAELAVERLQQIVGRWVQAEQRVIAVPEREPPRDAASVERGRELFHGEIVKCVGCHGVEGNGRAILVDFDDWTKEYTTRLSITPWNREALRPFRRAGALRPRPAEPRRLADGVFRGGADSETLYRRLVAGITGTPMPGVITSREPSATGLTSQQVWDLVHYVQSLGEVPR